MMSVQLAVALQHALDSLRHVVVLLPDHAGIEHRRGGGQRIHGREQRLLRQAPLQVDRGVQVGEGGGGRRVGVVVGGHVDRLHRGDRAVLGGGDPLLQAAHLLAQRRLVAHGGGDTAQQRRDLRACLGEAEDVVDEQQHVLPADVAEVLGHGQAGQPHPLPRAGRLVHLAEDQRHASRSPWSRSSRARGRSPRGSVLPPRRRPSSRYARWPRCGSAPGSPPSCPRRRRRTRPPCRPCGTARSGRSP